MASWSFTSFGINSRAGRSQYLRVGWELLRPGGHRALRAERIRRHDARGSGATKPVVYNTVEEIRRFGEVLGGLQATKANGLRCRLMRGT